MMQKKIYVTKPYLPPLEQLMPYLEDIWESRNLTNNGHYHESFEDELSSFLKVPYISLFANGTSALITALKCLDIKGEVITTPFSFAATAHSLLWSGIKPVFADVDPCYGNLDPKKVEEAITKDTAAILPVHVYGNPCNVEQLEQLASGYGLKVIYDAAHAFGVKYKGSSVLNRGDLSVLSFHATKCFNTFEGGAIVCHDKKTKERIDLLKNFGIADETVVIEPGINSKMNEFQAALGLLQLKHYEHVSRSRRDIVLLYRENLKGMPGLSWLDCDKDVEYNYSYFPVKIEQRMFGMGRDQLYEELKKENIFTRRYFYPLISNLPSYSSLPSAAKSNLPVANALSDQVLCLPLYPDLEKHEVNRICSLIKSLHL